MRGKGKAPVLWVVLFTDACCEPPTHAESIHTTRSGARGYVAARRALNFWRPEAFRIVRYVPAMARGKR